MPDLSFALVEGLVTLQHELLLFAAVFFAIGLLDELAVDAIYIWQRMRGRLATVPFDESEQARKKLSGLAAVFVPAWQESEVIGPTIAHALTAWPQENLRIYVGCYRNDPQTAEAVRAAAQGDARVRIVVVDADGPTSKSHCLNYLHAALCEDEIREGRKAHMVVLHDAEDMVDPAALSLLDEAVQDADFVQLPVMALPPASSRWVASHYSDEFAESHAKAMPVRDLLGCAVPGAGVGCAFARPILARLADESGGAPFPEISLTEDYELGLRIHGLGGRTRFVRRRSADGRLIATRAYFPDTIRQSVRQKTRWTHGIALQSWDRLGWDGRFLQRWMTMRDRRGPLAAILLGIAYTLVLTGIVLHGASEAGLVRETELSPTLRALLLLTFAGLLWRIVMRGIFTAREYGWRQGFFAMPRVFVSNIIAIMSGRRAFLAYVRALRGAPVVWDKTQHSAHPARPPIEGKPV